MAWTAEERQVVEALSNDTRSVIKRLETMETTPRKGGATPSNMFTGYDPTWRSDDWSKYAHLDAYGSGAALEMMGGGRQKRLSGMGQCFIKAHAELLVGRAAVVAHASLRQSGQLFGQGDGGL